MDQLLVSPSASELGSMNEAVSVVMVRLQKLLLSALPVRGYVSETLNEKLPRTTLVSLMALMDSLAVRLKRVSTRLVTDMA